MNIVKGMLILLFIAFLTIGCGSTGSSDNKDKSTNDDVISSDTGGDSTGTGSSNNDNNNNNGGNNNTGGEGGTSGNNNCGANYTTADLNGCFSPENTGWLSYYCFDGIGSWYLEDWNMVSYCTGAIKSGTYQVQGCTLTTCDNTGCEDSTVQTTESGILVDGEPYSENNGCN